MKNILFILPKRHERPFIDRSYFKNDKKIWKKKTMQTCLNGLRSNWKKNCSKKNIQHDFKRYEPVTPRWAWMWKRRSVSISVHSGSRTAFYHHNQTVRRKSKRTIIDKRYFDSSIPATMRRLTLRKALTMPLANLFNANRNTLNTSDRSKNDQEQWKHDEYLPADSGCE